MKVLGDTRLLLRSAALVAFVAPSNLHAQVSNSVGESASASTEYQTNGSSVAEPIRSTGLEEGKVIDAPFSQEIVVTATRREQSLQKVPIAITAIGGSSLSQNHINTSADLQQQVPNLTITNQVAAFTVYLRGIGQLATNPGQEPSVATYVDGVYQPTVYGSLLSLANIQRVEVIKGPQGTLFGRNATGGLLNIITQDPHQDPSADILLSYGNFRTVKASAYVTGGLGPSVSADLSAYYYNQMTGFGTNLFNGQRLSGTLNADIRGKLLIKPTDTTKIHLAASYTHNHSAVGNALAILAPTVDAGYTSLPKRNFYDINADTLPHNAQTNMQVSARIEQEFDQFDVVSISSYTFTKDFEIEDGDASPLPQFTLLDSQKDKVFTQELQIVSKKGSTLNWIAGAYYYDSSARGEPTGTGLRGTDFGCLQCGINARPTLKTRSIAGFGEATYQILPKLEVTAGLRYTSDYKKLGGVIETVGPDGTVIATTPGPQRHATFNKLTYRAIAAYHFTSDIMGYVSYSRGFKSGGYDTSVPDGNAFKPEVLDAYEAGLKTQMLDHRLRINLAGFYYDYKDLQQPVLLGSSGVQTTVNAANAMLYGIDLDGSLVVSHALSLNMGFGYLHSAYKNFDDAPCTSVNPDGTVTGFACSVTGKELINAPKFTFNVGATYNVPIQLGDINISVNYAYKDTFYYDLTNRLSQRHYGLLNGTLGWSPGNKGVTIDVFSENLLNEKYTTAEYVEPGFADRYGAGNPRQFGIELRAKF